MKEHNIFGQFYIILLLYIKKMKLEFYKVKFQMARVFYFLRMLHKGSGIILFGFSKAPLLGKV